MRNEANEGIQDDSIPQGDWNPAESASAEKVEGAAQVDESEAESQGRDVHDLTREGATHGLDVITDGEQPNIESHGRTVVDHSHRAEAHGVDVFDLGPNPHIDDESLDR